MRHGNGGFTSESELLLEEEGYFELHVGSFSP